FAGVTMDGFQFVPRRGHKEDIIADRRELSVVPNEDDGEPEAKQIVVQVSANHACFVHEETVTRDVGALSETKPYAHSPFYGLVDGGVNGSRFCASGQQDGCCFACEGTDFEVG